jgi:hypothetical protein
MIFSNLWKMSSQVKSPKNWLNHTILGNIPNTTSRVPWDILDGTWNKKRFKMFQHFIFGFAFLRKFLRQFFFLSRSFHYKFDICCVKFGNIFYLSNLNLTAILIQNFKMLRFKILETRNQFVSMYWMCK